MSEKGSFERESNRISYIYGQRFRWFAIIINVRAHMRVSVAQGSNAITGETLSEDFDEDDNATARIMNA